MKVKEMHGSSSLCKFGGDFDGGDFKVVISKW
jgi:hypothetical protein